MAESRSNGNDQVSSNGKSEILISFCALSVQCAENFAFVTLATNLLVFCTNFLNLDITVSSTISLVFSGISLIFPLFGGWLADSTLGRYNGILGGSLLYLVAIGGLCLISFPYNNYITGSYLDNNSILTIFGLSLFLICIATGGIKSNVSPFGAEQLTNKNEETIRSFFAFFFWLVNIGAILSRTIVIYVQTEVEFFYGFLIVFIVLLLAITLYLSQRSSYRCHRPSGSILTTFYRILKQAIYRRITERKENIKTLDHALISYGGTFQEDKVEDLRRVLATLPIFLCTVFYYTIFFQIQSSYLAQGLVLDLKLGDFQIPPASLTIFDTVCVLIFIPFLDQIIYPKLIKRGYKITMLRRMGLGMIFATISVTAAGIIEQYRKHHVNDSTIVNHISGNLYNASSISVLIQIPQFGLIGLSEVFTITSSFEFAGSQSPFHVQGILMGFLYAMAGLGALVGSGFVNVVKSISDMYTKKSWYANDPNQGQLEYYFYLLACLMFINFILFYFISNRYKYVDYQSNEDRNEIAEPKYDAASSLL